MNNILPNDFTIHDVINGTENLYSQDNNTNWKFDIDAIISLYQQQNPQQVTVPYSIYPNETSINKTYLGGQVYETILTIDKVNFTNGYSINIGIDRLLEYRITAKQDIFDVFVTTFKDSDNTSDLIHIGFVISNGSLTLFDVSDGMDEFDSVTLLLRYTKI